MAEKECGESLSEIMARGTGVEEVGSKRLAVIFGFEVFGAFTIVVIPARFACGAGHSRVIESWQNQSAASGVWTWASVP